MGKRKKISLAVVTLGIVAVAVYIGVFHRRRRTRPVTNQVVVLGFDGVDANLAAQWIKEGKLPNLARLAATGTFKPLLPTNPPESPTSWASFATGLNPGGTGIFDFLNRNVKTYMPVLSLVKRIKPKFLFGLIPIRPPKIINERHGPPFYQVAADAGYKTLVLRMPLEFPPHQIPGGELWAGLSVPDVLGTWGTFYYFGTDLTPWDVGDTEFGGKLVRLVLKGDTAVAQVEGPVNPAVKVFKRVTLPIRFTVAPSGNAVTIQFGENKGTIAAGHWSRWFRARFPITPFISVSGICRFYVLETSPDLRVYMSPINIDPASPILPISYPANFTSRLVKRFGLFKTLGWPDATWALNENRISDNVFLEDAFRTQKHFARITLYELKHHQPSLMVSVFYFTDEISHMFYRLMDPESPSFNPEEAKAEGNPILKAYEVMDRTVGEIMKAMKPGATLIIVSDHGFHPWRWGFNTNTWLVENGYMTLKNPNASTKVYNLAQLFGQGSFFPNVDWKHTEAYALGLGQIYLNLKGREKDGIVNPGPQARQLLEQIRQKLLAYRDPDTHQPVLEAVELGSQIFHGPYVKQEPDLQLNFEPGYRTSWQTSLGAIPRGVVVANLRDWSGDHCASDPKDTRGIFFSNRRMTGANPRIWDVAPTVLHLLGVKNPPPMDGRVLYFDPPGQ